jgi:hypothetical protein
MDISDVIRFASRQSESASGMHLVRVIYNTMMCNIDPAFQRSPRPKAALSLTCLRPMQFRMQPFLGWCDNFVRLGFTLGFRQHLNYEVSVRHTRGGPLIQKPLLADVSGYVRPGMMLALMGMLILLSIASHSGLQAALAPAKRHC